MTSNTDQKIVDILKRVGMITEGHFIGKKSGKHFHTFIDKDKLLAQPRELSKICKIFAKKIHSEIGNIDTVVGPVSGGALVASWVASYLSELSDREVNAVYLDKNGQNKSCLRSKYRGFIKERKVLVVDDVIRTGSTLMRAAEIVQKSGGYVVMLGAILNRNPSMIIGETLGFPLIVGVDFEEKGYEKNEIPQWLQKIPLDKQGERVVIGVTGRIGVGKSTFIKEFISRFPDTERVATGDVLKETLSLWGVPHEREKLMLLSRLLKDHLGSNVIVNAVRRRIESSQSRYVLIDGVRAEKVYSLLREYKGSLLIVITADLKNRYQRVILRSEKPDESKMSFEDFVALDERGFQKELNILEQKADIRIENNSDYNSFLAQIESFIANLK